jgi:hypothetical protein
MIMTEDKPHSFGFFALWDSKTSEYHASEQDELNANLWINNAFKQAHEKGVRIYGSYYCRWSTERKTFTFWWAPSFEVLENAMDDLEKAGDFRFAESEHRIGIMNGDDPQTNNNLSSLENGNKELPFAFVAFWSWKDSYYRASQAERSEHRNAVNKVFLKAKQMGIQMLGNYKCSSSSRWDYFTFWLSPSFEAIEETMDLLEAAGDFKFAESRHIIGNREIANRFGRHLQF